ncbi:MAG: thiamine-phosphate kinase [Pseudomonadota bacterium]
MDEFGRIARFFAPLAGPEGLGLGDDAALFTPAAGQQLVVSKDICVAGVHVPLGCAAQVVARRALRPNLSDLAAMGAAPLGYLLGVSLPDQINETWLSQFSDALAADQTEFGIKLWGGDSVRAPQDLSISMTILGAVPTGQALQRSGGRAGDDIYVSGQIGLAAAGLQIALGRADGDEAWRCAYEAPQPRLALGQALRGLATAAIDVSDGLVADVGHLADASGCQAILTLADIPIGPGLPLDDVDAIAAGDDYELAFTAGPERREEIFTLSETLGLSLTRIGAMRARAQGDAAILVLGDEGSPISLKRQGWRHA